MDNVFTAVVANDLCSGCGVCAGVAPCSMHMVCNRAGEYVPAPPTECSDCGLCVRVCPFASPLPCPAPSPLGNALAHYVGYMADADHRARAASGGLTTGVLTELLRRGAVDGIVAVTPAHDPGTLFRAAILDDPAQVMLSAKSRYYPIEFSDILRQVRAQRKRYAVVALPCTVRALRLAQAACPWLAESLRYIIGLTCGHGVSKHYTSFLSHLAGLRPEQVTEVDYRGKAATRADEYLFRAGTGARHGRPLASARGPVGAVWTGYFFSLNACHYCEDLFAEHADLSVMDAWLPQYASDPRGHSIVCVRNEALHDLLQDMAHGETVVLQPLAEEQVLASQAVALRFKSERLAARLGALQRQGIGVPIGRVQPQARRVSLQDRLLQHQRRLSRLLVRGRSVRLMAGCAALRLNITLGWGLLLRIRHLLGAVRRRADTTGKQT